MKGPSERTMIFQPWWAKNHHDGYHDIMDHGKYKKKTCTFYSATLTLYGNYNCQLYFWWLLAFKYAGDYSYLNKVSGDYNHQVIDYNQLYSTLLSK